MLPVFLATVVIVIIIVLATHHYRKSYHGPCKFHLPTRVASAYFFATPHTFRNCSILSVLPKPGRVNSESDLLDRFTSAVSSAPQGGSLSVTNPANGSAMNNASRQTTMMAGILPSGKFGGMDSPICGTVGRRNNNFTNFSSAAATLDRRGGFQSGNNAATSGQGHNQIVFK